jgi:heme A synthase
MKSMLDNRFARFAWGVLAYNLLVILWGAYVRASGSGAGCGSHWPLCNGEVAPRAPRIETLIELTHRATSGIALILVVALFVWALRLFPRGHHVRMAATLSLVLIVVEALIGAGLVLLELVAGNASAARAFSIVLHLVNTFLLLGALTLTAWWASGGAPIRWRMAGGLAWLLLMGLAGTGLIGATGAVTALGDTLFPAASLSEGLRQDFTSTAHFLTRLRVVHPVLAVTIGFGLIALARGVGRARSGNTTTRLARLVIGLVVVQLIAGAVNVGLLAPIPMQLLHLLLADLLWIGLVLLTASALGLETVRAEWEQVSRDPAGLGSPDPA